MHTVDSPPTGQRGTSYLLSCTSFPFQKGVYSKRKEIAPLGSKFFPFRVDLFSEERLKHFYRACSLENVSIPYIISPNKREHKLDSIYNNSLEDI